MRIGIQQLENFVAPSQLQSVHIMYQVHGKNRKFLIVFQSIFPGWGMEFFGIIR